MKDLFRKSTRKWIMLAVAAFCFLGSWVLCERRTYSASAAEREENVYFEIEKNPIERVQIDTDFGGEVRQGERVTPRIEVFPENARLTVVETSLRILSGSDYATVEETEIVVDADAPIGKSIEVAAVVDGIESENSLLFTVVQTPVEEIKFLNAEDEIIIGRTLLLEAEILPKNATNKGISYSIISGSDYLQVSYNGVLSFINSAIPLEDFFVSIRATSASNPNIYADKTIKVARPTFDTVLADKDLSEVEQQRSYSFASTNEAFDPIFQGRPVYYRLDVGEDIASIDVNGILTISPTAPIGSRIIVSLDTIDGTTHYQQTLEVVPVFATAFTPVILTAPSLQWNGIDYYLPGDAIQFDIASYEPANVTECNKQCVLMVNNESLAIAEGDTVIINSEVQSFDPHFTVTVYSEINKIEASFEIMIYIPVSSVLAAKTVDELRENRSYVLEDILDSSYAPLNAMPRDMKYHLVETDSDFATIRDNQLIINDNLPAGELRVGLVYEIDNICSDTVYYSIYKPTSELGLSAMVNGISSDFRLPISSKNTADTVILCTRVDEAASKNHPNFTVSLGEEYIDGSIQFVGINNGVGQWQFSLKKNLAQAETEHGALSPIVIFAAQDDVTSNVLEIAIHIPDEDLTAHSQFVERGTVNKITFEHTKNTTITSVDWKVSDIALTAGVYRLDDSIDSFFVPQNLPAGTKILLEYRSDDPEFFGRDGEWKQVEMTVDKLQDSEVTNIYDSAVLQRGFNVIFTTDSEGYIIGKNYVDPQLWHGRSTTIDLKYNNDLIDNYGIKINTVTVNGPAIELENQRTSHSLCVFANEDAVGKEEIRIEIVVQDGEALYTITTAPLYIFREMRGKLEFNEITANSINVTKQINKNASTFDFQANDGIGMLKFELLMVNEGVSVSQDGKITVSSYAIAKKQTIQYSYKQYYNDVGIDYKETSVITFKTISVDNAGGYGRTEIIALDSMGTEASLSDIRPTRDGYKFLGYYTKTDGAGSQICDKEGNLKVSAITSTIYADWLKVFAKIEFSSPNNGRDQKITDADKYVETIYPSLDREKLRFNGYSNLKITITFDCQEINDGYQDLWVYSHKDQQIASFTVEHGSGHKDTSWWSHTKEFTTSIDNVQTDGSFWLRWGAHGNFADDWNLGHTVITVEALEEK